MSNRFTSAIKGIVASIVLVANIFVAFPLLIAIALVKLIVPITPVRKVTDGIMNGIAEMWISINKLWMRMVQPQAWQASGVTGLKRRGWYLVSSNHQSWVDILVLQRVFNRRIPLLKFFLKRQLIYVPLMGLAWWALDFPFMRRGGGGNAAKDLATARKACEKFRIIPTSVISFVEGTRFTPAKHDEQKSPYQHLLKPKTGGLAMALATLGDRFDAMLDITIVYPGGVPTFIDLMCGRVKDVVVRVDQVQIPAKFQVAEELRPADYRAKLQAWVNELWLKKDRDLEAMLAQFQRGEKPAGTIEV